MARRAVEIAGYGIMRASRKATDLIQRAEGMALMPEHIVFRAAEASAAQGRHRFGMFGESGRHLRQLGNVVEAMEVRDQYHF